MHMTFQTSVPTFVMVYLPKHVWALTQYGILPFARSQFYVLLVVVARMCKVTMFLQRSSARPKKNLEVERFPKRRRRLSSKDSIR